jgi:ribonuclease HIII
MNFVLKLNEIQSKRIMTFYRDYQSTTNNQSVLFFAKTEFVSVSVYTSYKVMFQGTDSEKEYMMWCTMLGITSEETPSVKKVESKKVSSDYFLSSIGSDEVGTGDFFGPIVVCAAYIKESDIPFLKSLKIDDSKKITDDRIRVIGQQLKDKITYSMLALHNEKFNEMTKKGYNMNKLKAYLHNTAIISLTQKLGFKTPVILDQFAESKLYFSYLKSEKEVFKDIIFTTKAESKYASVAVGSIIARYAFLQYFDILSEESGYDLLKGASNKVDQLVAKIIKEKGINYLNKIAKTNFVTIDKAKALI